MNFIFTWTNCYGRWNGGSGQPEGCELDWPSFLGNRHLNKPQCKELHEITLKHSAFWVCLKSQASPVEEKSTGDDRVSAHSDGTDLRVCRSTTRTLKNSEVKMKYRLFTLWVKIPLVLPSVPIPSWGTAAGSGVHACVGGGGKKRNGIQKELI